MINYQVEGYEGLTISLVEKEYISVGDSTISCIINPRGTDYTHVYLWYGEPLWFTNSPFNCGIALGSYSGSAEIPISYSFDMSRFSIGETIPYMFQVSNNKRWTYVLSTVLVVEPTQMHIAVQGGGDSIWWSSVDTGTKDQSDWNLLTGSSPSSPSIYVSGARALLT
jgi:hypothetical protein